MSPAGMGGGWYGGNPRWSSKNIRSGTFTLIRISSKKESKAPAAFPAAPAHVTGAPGPPAAPALPSPAAPPRRRGVAATRSPLRVCPPRAPGPTPSSSSSPPPPPSTARAAEPSAWPPRAAAGARPGAPRASASSRLAAPSGSGAGTPGSGPRPQSPHLRHAPRSPSPGAVGPGDAVLRCPRPPPRRLRAAPAPLAGARPAGARRRPSLRLLRSPSSCTRDARSGEKRRAAAAAGTSTREEGGRSARAAEGGGGAPRPRLLLSRERTCIAGRGV